MTIEKRARAKHINSIAKDFMCAMISNAHYWDIHDVANLHSSFGKVLGECFSMAEEFVDREIKTK